jgi:ADP-heptose:LPS heptosyltransferase
VVIAGGLGDCIYYSYIFQAIKNKYKQSRITCIVWSHGYPSPFHHNPAIDELIEIKDFRSREKFDKIMHIVDTHFDYVYAINHIRELYNLINLFEYDTLFAHYSFNESYRKVVPPDILARIDEQKAEGYSYPNFDLNPEDTRPQVYYTNEHKIKVRNILDSLPGNKKTIVISLASADTERTIPFEIQAQIVHSLSNHYNVIGVARFSNIHRDMEQFKACEILRNTPIKLILDTDGEENLGINGLVALLQEVDYFITPLSMGIAVGDCSMIPTLTIMAYRHSIQDLIVQFCNYSPNLLMLVDDLHEVSFGKILKGIVFLSKFSKWSLRMHNKANIDDSTRMILDYREKFKDNNSKTQVFEEG